MSVNHSLGINTQKTKHLGQYINTIDFVLNTVSKKFVENKKDDVIVGNFYINDTKQAIDISTLNFVCNSGNLEKLKLPNNITKFETSYIIETFKTAKTVFFQKIRLNV